jgi:FKBP-type peptidyl-prolyl cis-trans isomerase (trigger factor)
MYQHIISEQKKYITAQGFSTGNVPLEYIQDNFKGYITEHLKEFLLSYFVTSFLYHEIRHRKLLVADEPRLISREIGQDHQGHFLFELSVFNEISLREWKYFPFNAPKRKNYKDLDRQVESFIKEEYDALHKRTNETVNINDWVRFGLTLISSDNIPLIDHKEVMWFRIGDEEVDSALGSIFIGKHIGDIFCSNSQEFQQVFSSHTNVRYLFCIEILDVLHHDYFCIDQFKKQFKLKTNKEIHQKLIEVFSYRNNLSQRRTTAEESLKLLLNKHRFTIPNYLVLRQQKQLLNIMRTSPDYYVYRMQKDFKERVRQLAEKQAKEKLILDQIAYQENLEVSEHDIKYFLNLINRHRTKEFIYFDLPSTKLNGQEIPISEQELKRICLREKALNYIIYHLTKK